MIYNDFGSTLVDKGQWFNLVFYHDNVPSDTEILVTRFFTKKEIVLFKYPQNSYDFYVHDTKKLTELVSLLSFDGIEKNGIALLKALTENYFHQCFSHCRYALD